MMNSKQKQKKLNRNISVALAVLIVATLCVTIAALTASRRVRDNGDNIASSTIDTVATADNTSTEHTDATSSSDNTATDAQSPTSGSDTPTVKVIEWTCPAAGNLIKEYSADIPVFSLTMEDYRVHAGIDIAGDAGDDVMAAADGVIENVYYDPMMGQTVVISHGDDYKSIYQNLQTVVPDGVAAGAAVTAGQKIGTVGDTALIEISENPHLHFSMTFKGNSVDPLSYIDVSEAASSVWYED